MQPNTGLPVPQPRRQDQRFQEREAGPVVPAGAEPRRGLGAIGAVLLTLLAKGKTILVFLPKVFLTTFSMLAMVWFEAQRSGIWFAVGFVVSILIHELGHGYAMKRAGVQAGWPVFIPFFGAMIAMKGQPRDRDTEARIAYGGPLAGTIAAIAAVGLAFALGSRVAMAVAYTGFFLNLFNLTPFSPLDGGRIAQAFSRRAWILGAALLVGLLLVTHAPQLMLILLLALPRLFGRGDGDTREALAPALQRRWALRYFGLAGLLAGGIYFTSLILHPSIHADEDEAEGVSAQVETRSGPTPHVVLTVAR
ncbi:MAG TPA: site-2 protease family protein [Polyangiaceae bacterium]|jgi:Zn-dependent protease|nr:site-2 protease family protein [Polyangiaceae bacterium]